MQGMRERIEARRAAALPWLCSLADKAAEAAKKGAVASAASGKENDKGKGKAKATTTTAAAAKAAASSSPCPTMLSPANAARARDELRVSRQQVPLAFEALLALKLGLESPEMKEAVRARLAASVAAAMSDAASKRVFDAPRPNPLAAAMAAAAAGGEFSFSRELFLSKTQLSKNSNDKKTISPCFPPLSFFSTGNTPENALQEAPPQALERPTRAPSRDS